MSEEKSEDVFDFGKCVTNWNFPKCKSLCSQAQFATLTDYFNAVYKAKGVSQGTRPPDYPVLSGDFFAYADREDHYWSGYYTSRPFYKNLDRVLESHLRLVRETSNVCLISHC